MELDDRQYIELVDINNKQERININFFNKHFVCSKVNSASNRIDVENFFEFPSNIKEVYFNKITFNSDVFQRFVLNDNQKIYFINCTFNAMKIFFEGGKVELNTPIFNNEYAKVNVNNVSDMCIVSPNFDKHNRTNFSFLNGNYLTFVGDDAIGSLYINRYNKVVLANTKFENNEENNMILKRLNINSKVLCFSGNNDILSLSPIKIKADKINFGDNFKLSAKGDIEISGVKEIEGDNISLNGEMIDINGNIYSNDLDNVVVTKDIFDDNSISSKRRQLISILKGTSNYLKENTSLELDKYVKSYAKKLENTSIKDRYNK